MNKEYYICLLDMIKGLSTEEKNRFKKMKIEEIKYYYHMEYLSIEEEIQEV